MKKEFYCKSCEENDFYSLTDINECNIGTECKKFIVKAPPQAQDVQPGMEYLMEPLPIFDNPNYQGNNRLKDKIAIVTGGDSGLGRAISVYFAKEGAKVIIVYLDEHDDATFTKNYIESFGGTCNLISGDLKNPCFCKEIIQKVINTFGKIDILVNNAGVQYQQKQLEDISNEQFDFTMKTNIYSMFYLTKEALPHMNCNSSIINTTSVTTFYGEPELIDYVTSKGAIVGFTRALATNLATKGIRVNAVAPGFFWTPLQPACWQPNKIPTLGADADMRRMADPYEIASTYVYLASDDASYTTGQVIHVNGGQYKG